MRYLTKEQLLLVHSLVIDETGGVHGIRDAQAVLSSEAAPRQSVFGKEMFPDIFQKAAAYARGIFITRPFNDGNKRTALAAAAVFLAYNGYQFSAKEKASAQFFAKLSPDKFNLKALTSWLTQHVKKR